MIRRHSFLAILAVSLVAAPAALSAQDTTRARPDSARAGMMGMGGHMAGPWKELNSFHQVLMATWHPAQKDDLAPARSRSKEMLTAAETWAASTPPAHPEGCATEPVRAAPGKVVAAVKAMMATIDANGTDASVKTSLKSAHDAFEVAEKGCRGHGHP